MPVAFAALSDRGQLRENNEDAVRVEADAALAVLADGMGGYSAGEVASGMAIALIGAEMARWATGPRAHPLVPDDAALLEAARAVAQAVDNANLTIWSAAQVNADYHQMGTTVVVAQFLPERLVLAHVGDSRAYRLRGPEFRQLTRDHSLLQEQLDAGLISAEEAALSPQRNLLTRALGVMATVEVEVHVHAVAPGDLYLLCSDGLTDMLGDADLAELLGGSGDLEQKATALVAAANAQGGRDNISVILATPSPASPLA